MTATLINKALARGQMQTGGLAKTLLLKVNAKVMLTSNITSCKTNKWSDRDSLSY